jgi:hypothetical protein
MFECFDRRLRYTLVRGCLLLFSTAILASAPVAALATPLLSEVLYDALGSDDGHGFVELSGVPGTLLDGMTLEGVNGAGGAIGPVITLMGVIASDGLFVVADTRAGTTSVPSPDQLANFDFQNGPDSIVLRDAGGTAVDRLGYGSFGVGDVFAGEGMAAPDAPAGSSLARLFADVDSDDNFSDFRVLAVPTPGQAEFEVVPEPGTATMMLVGLACLAVLNRRFSRTR